MASATDVPSFLAGRLHTLPSPGGRLLCKFATVSDVHIGEKHFGVLGRIHDPGENVPGEEPYPVTPFGPPWPRRRRGAQNCWW